MLDISVIVKDFKKFDKKEIEIGGWVLSNRDSSKIGFISMSDGTCFEPVQVVYKEDCKDFETFKKLRGGSGLSLKGTLMVTPDAKQDFEIVATSIDIVSEAIEKYPMQKKRQTVEFLRDWSHIRSRTNLFRAVFSVRDVAAKAVHDYFNSENFKYVHAPIITTNDGEGAGEAFVVATPDQKDLEHSEFFNANATLGVTGQLHAEAMAQSFKKVYTFAPTFRAEKSNTSRHAAEFWMIEPEVAFNKLPQNMDLIQGVVQYVTKTVMKECKSEIEFFNKFVEKGLKDRLDNAIKKDFERISYTDAIEILKKADVKFEESKIEWGMDLGSEHERYISEQHVKGPVFLYDYPADIKAFYMAANDDNKTVAACDLLVPSIGELVGGSQREHRYDVLLEKCKDFNIDPEELEWYLDLRRFGGVVSSGFGIGFERLVMFLTGVKNIRDVVPFPRAYKMCKF